MQFIREAAGKGAEMPYTPEAMAQIFTALFEKIHPLAIGAIEQSYALAKLIGIQCLGCHMDPKSQEPQIRSIVDKLCDDYKSHAYQISRAEARDIGLQAVDADTPLEEALNDLLKLYFSRRVAPPAPPKAGQTIGMPIAWLDSSQLFMRADTLHKVLDDGRLELLSDAWQPY
jgi:hypothetical protein